MANETSKFKIQKNQKKKRRSNLKIIRTCTQTQHNVVCTYTMFECQKISWLYYLSQLVIGRLKKRKRKKWTPWLLSSWTSLEIKIKLFVAKTWSCGFFSILLCLHCIFLRLKLQKQAWNWCSPQSFEIHDGTKFWDS